MRSLALLTVLLLLQFSPLSAQTNLEAVGYYEAVKVIESVGYQITDTPVVAIIDNGVNIMHEDLRGNIWRNHSEIPANGIDDDGNGFVDDLHGWNFSSNSNDVTAGGSGNWHGTPVNGIIGAVHNNIGIDGICPVVRLLNIVKGESIESIIKSLQYIYNMRDMYNRTNGEFGAYIVAVNCSWGKDSLFACDYPEWCLMYEKLGSLGVLCVNSVPNDNIDVDVYGDMPTTCQSDYIITVTNSNLSGDKISDSAYGYKSVDMATPGNNTYTTLNNGGYGYFGGTSASAPYVSGAIGLLYLLPIDEFQNDIVEKPEETALLVKSAIMNGVNVTPQLNGITVSGGHLNIFNSIKNICDYYNACYIYNNLFKSLELASLYPNPASSLTNLKLECNNITDVTINVKDFFGNTRKTIAITIDDGVTVIPIDLYGLHNGIFYICIESSSTIIIEKILINQ